MDELKAYYESWDEDTRLASRHGQVEFLTTMHFIDRYLRPGMRVLEIGAGTGRYSHALAQRGYEVDAVELIAHNIDVFRKKTQPGERVTIRQGNALDLADFADGSYDVTLLLGPMYHLHTEGEQKRALQEALRVTRRGGVLFAAYCGNDATMFQSGFGQGDIQREPYKSLIDPATFKAASTPGTLFHLYRKEDVDALMAGFAVKRLHYAAVDLNVCYLADAIDRMDDALFAQYMRYNLFLCERPDMVGLASHILDVSRKEGRHQNQGSSCE